VAKRTKREAPPGISKETVLAWFAGHPGGTKRDLARALGARGDERQALKRVLRELALDGAIEKGKGKSFTRPGDLPEVTVIEISGEDPDGEPIGHPVHWTLDTASPTVIIVPGREDVGPALGRGERVLARISRTKTGYEGRVIKRLGASAHRVLGVVVRSDGHVRVDPVDRKTKFGFTVDVQASEVKDGQLVLVEPLAGRASGLPRARIIEQLGSVHEPKTVSLIAIHAHGIPTDFPVEAIHEARSAQPVSLGTRTDLRNVPLVTIDPEDARDHDDAVWAEPDKDPNNRGGHIVIVAIADVAHYVQPGSALDREARKRGNSVYFPDRVVPMLPEELSADLCSLREGEDRACLAVRMVFDAEGNKRRHEFLRGLMRSAAKLTYAQAQAAFDGKPDGKAATVQVSTLAPVWAAYQAVARARDKRSPLELDLPERRIILGSDGRIQSIAFRERLESMRVIEEFMIQANVSAAETLEKSRTPLLYRVHEKPSLEKLVSFADYLRTIGIPFAKGQVIKPAVFNRILQHAKGTPHEEVLNDVVLRTQAQAVYAAENVGHFGLNLSDYAHFTSPIRRYADLVVHRALIRARQFGDDGLTTDEIARLDDTAEHISMTERRAMAAERDSVDRYVAAFMQDRVGAVFQARVTGVTRFGLFLRLAETGADGLLPMRALGGEFFRHDEKRHALVGQQSGTVYNLGDRFAVRLAEAAPLTGGLRFELPDGETAPSRPARGRPRPAGPRPERGTAPSRASRRGR
jgi:ribonuclease R